MFYHLFVEKVMINNCYVLKVTICIIFVEINCRYFIFVFNKNDCSEWVGIDPTISPVRVPRSSHCTLLSFFSSFTLKVKFPQLKVFIHLKANLP